MSTLELIRYDTETLSLVFTDENGTAYNLTGGTVFFTIKSITDNADNDDSALLKKEQATHTSAVLGQTEIILTPAEMGAIPANEYKGDFQFVDSSGNVKSSNRIKILVIDDVTKRIS